MTPKILSWIRSQDLAKTIRSVLSDQYRIAHIKDFDQLTVFRRSIEPRLFILEESTLMKQARIELRKKEQFIDLKASFEEFISEAKVDLASSDRFFTEYFENRWSLAEGLKGEENLWNLFVYTQFIRDLISENEIDVPVLVLVEDDSEEIFEINQRAGASEVLKLPVTHQSLLQIVDAFMVTMSSQSSGASSSDQDISELPFHFRNPLDPRHHFMPVDESAISGLIISLNNLKDLSDELVVETSSLSWLLNDKLDLEKIKKVFISDPVFSTAFDITDWSDFEETSLTRWKKTFDVFGLEYIVRILLVCSFEDLAVSQQKSIAAALFDKFFSRIAVAELAANLFHQKEPGQNQRKVFFGAYLMDIGESLLIKSLENTESCEILFENQEYYDYLIYPRHVATGEEFLKSLAIEDDFLDFVSSQLKLEKTLGLDKRCAYFADLIVSSAGICHQSWVADPKLIGFWLKFTGLSADQACRALIQTSEAMMKKYKPFLISHDEERVEELGSLLATYLDHFNQMLGEIYQALNQGQKLDFNELAKRTPLQDISDIDFPIQDPKIPEAIIQHARKILKSVYFLEDYVKLLRQFPVLTYYTFSLSPQTWESFLKGSISLKSAVKEIGRDSIVLLLDSFGDETILKTLSPVQKALHDEYLKRSRFRSRACEVLSQLKLNASADTAFIFSQLSDLGEYFLITEPDLNEEHAKDRKKFIETWANRVTQLHLRNCLGINFSSIYKMTNDPYEEDLIELDPYPLLLFCSRYIEQMKSGISIDEQTEDNISKVLNRSHWDMTILKEVISQI